MSLSVFDLFKIGIGPSSSHTVGPMWATNRFLLDVQTQKLLEHCENIGVDLYGSLAMTGHGHATDKAILLGLLGEVPNTTDADSIEDKIAEIRKSGKIKLLGEKLISFTESDDLRFNFGDFLELHSNGMIFTASDSSGSVLLRSTYYSVGGGFIMDEAELLAEKEGKVKPSNVEVPYPFSSANDLLALGDKHGLSFSEIIWENEKAMRNENEIKDGMRNLRNVMDACIERGCSETGILPGGLEVPRRASKMREALKKETENFMKLPLKTMDWVNLFALAVNEENAAGGRVVTAPTNGAAGVIPAVLAYYERFVPDANEEGVFKFLLTATAIGILYKENASISAAEVGCQGEVGVACSMAAGALTAVLGGSNHQIENAAEIAMEHNLGLTCDPIGGLVQIPCIERNTMGAVKAINAARLAMHGDGTHFVSLDKVIRTMFETGKDMQTKYKETSTGGLAVNEVAC